MNKIRLSNLELKTFTEQDTSDYCQLNSINHEDIIYLNLQYNELTDISVIQNFKNLQELWCKNGFKNMSVTEQLYKNINIYE